jgi:hypothetical protein
VIGEALGGVPPFREQWLIRSAARDIAAYRHRAECAAVIALTTRNHPVPLRLAGLQMILPRKLDGRFGGFRTTGGEVDAAAILKICRRKL